MKKTYQTWRSMLIASLFLFLWYNGTAQGFPVVGKVMTADNLPLPGVTVEVQGTNVKTVTNANGTYTITAPSEKSVLTFSYVGYTPQTAPLNGKSTVNIFLAQQTTALESVVVVGYGTQKKKNVTGAIASYNAEDIQERPLTRVDQALVGQMAGVQVKQTSGTPGKAFSIQVRGSGSISAGNEPLYVIDGFPLATSQPNTSGNFATGNPLDNINPNDIESIQVLKDASSAAIYGSRAGNGVVLITTKRGKSGKPKISYNGYAGYTEASRKLDMLSGPEWIERAIEMINGDYVNVYRTVGATAADDYERRRFVLANPPAGLQPIILASGEFSTRFMHDPRWTKPGYPGLRFFNWQDEAFRKGLLQNHQVSASGGSEFVRYYLSANLADQDGFVKAMGYRQYSGRANLEVSPNKKITFGINVAPTYSITDDPGVEGKDNILHQMASMTPVQEDTMGLYPNVGTNAQYRWSTSTNSPIGKLEQVLGQNKRFRTLTSLFAEWKPITGLTLRSSVNLDNTDNNAKGYTPFTVASNLDTRTAQTTAQASGSFTGFKKQTLVHENTASYTKIIGDDHDLSLLAGFAYNQDKIDNYSIRTTAGFRNALVNTLNWATSPLTSSTSETKNVLISYFGRVQYSFNDKYIFQASVRRDGASRFGANTKWGVFPAGSVAWRMIDEDFMKNLPVFSDLKLRFSYGKAGNYNISDYPSIPILGGYNYTFNGSQAIGLAPSRIANPDIAWEKSRTIDVGLDVGLFRNRITTSFDWYEKYNDLLLLNVPIPAVTGFPTFLNNAGASRNKGWDLELTTRNFTGAFQWTTTANMSYNANKVERLAEGQTQLLVPSAFDISHTLLRIGAPMNSIYVVRKIGILTEKDIADKVALFGTQTVGDPKYQDQPTIDTNGDGIPDKGDGVINANDRVIVGQPNPKYAWGITNNFRFKGFDLNVLVQGQWGGSIYSLLGRALNRTGMGVVDNPLGTWRNRWRSPSNPGNGEHGKTFSTFGRIKNTDWLYPSDYVRIRNITLGYDMGRLVKDKNIDGFRIYLSAENFFGWDKYKGGWNPEASNTDLSGSSDYPEAGDYGGLPLPKTLILGINITL